MRFSSLRAIIKGHAASLDGTAELDVYTPRAKYGVFLNSVTLEEHQHTSKLHKYTSDQTVETLLSWLRAPHSPMVKDEEAPDTSAVL